MVHRLDKKELFKYPVTRDIASDYYEIIKKPMSFTDVLDKLSQHFYLTLDDLADDISLIWKNSMLYNDKDTLYYKLAQRLEKTARSLIEEARQNYKSLPISKSGLLDVEVNREIFVYVDDALKINTTVEQSSSGLSSLSTISSDSSLSMKRRVSDMADTPMKKPKEDEQARKHVSRVTRSKTQNNMRMLRSRSITKDMHHPVKMGRSDSLPETKRKRSALRRQTSTLSEPTNINSPMQESVESRMDESVPAKIGIEKRNINKPAELEIDEPVTVEKSTKKPTTDKPIDILSTEVIIEKPTIDEPIVQEYFTDTPTIEEAIIDIEKQPNKESAADVIMTEAPAVHEEESRNSTKNKQTATEPVTVIQRETRATRASSHRVENRTVPLKAPVKPNIVQLLKPKSSFERKPEAKSEPVEENHTVNFQHGELVWARVRGFPPHPAHVS